MSDLTQDSFSDFCFVFSLCAMGHLLCLVMHRSADFAWALKAIFLRRLFVSFFLRYRYMGFPVTHWPEASFVECCIGRLASCMSNAWARGLFSDRRDVTGRVPCLMLGQ